MAYTTIDDPSEYFQTVLYTGTGATRSVTNTANAGDFRPDWVWIKARSFGESHMLYDSTRGVTKDLRTDGSNAENTNTTGLTSFDTNGFSTGSMQNVNKNTSTYVAWQWKANGGTTATNDASSTSIGNTDSVIQANTEAGFSIVTYTGTGSAGTIAHGLGATPNLVIVKERGNTNSWLVQSNLFSSSNFVTFLNRSDTGGENDSSTFNGTFPTSSVFSVGTHTGTNRSSGTYVAYCFTSIKGYSKIGSYTGNGSTDGPFVYTGFKPAWLMIKNVEQAGGQWFIHDNKRETFNPSNSSLFAESSQAETANNSALDIDFLSNGWKKRNTGSGANNDGIKYIYMAFAEHPFVSSKGVPTTAR